LSERGLGRRSISPILSKRWQEPPSPYEGEGTRGVGITPQRKTSREGTLSLRPAKIRQRRGAIRLILAHLSEITVQSGQFLSA